jgi:hypothetical protein
MPILEITAAIASILSGFATCTKYAKDLHNRHREKEALAAEAALLHKALSASDQRLRNEWVRIERHFQGHSDHYSPSLQYISSIEYY